MNLFTIFLLSLVAPFSTAYVVTVHLYDSDSLKCGADKNDHICYNLKQGSCCFVKKKLPVKPPVYIVRQHGSIRISGMPFTALGFGMTSSTAENACGEILTSKRGYDVCMERTKSDKKFKGAKYVIRSASDKEVRDADSTEIGAPHSDQDCTPFEVNRATIGGHRFYMNYFVPFNHSRELDELVYSNAQYEDVPEHLKQWEVSGVELED